jgi:hypothetical protein
MKYRIVSLRRIANLDATQTPAQLAGKAEQMIYSSAIQLDTTNR